MSGVDGRGAPRDEAVQAFMDALLTRAAEDARADERALEAALTPGRRGVLRLVRWAPLAAAASLLLGLGLIATILGGPGASSARAAMGEVLENVRLGGLRAYELELEGGPADVIRIDGRVHTDGGERFAVFIEGNLGRSAWFGGSGQDRWLVPSLDLLPAFEGDDPSALVGMFDRYGMALPVIDVVEILQACARDYRLDLAPDGRRIEGRRKRRAGLGPERFELVLGEGNALESLHLTGGPPIGTLGGWDVRLTASDATFDPSVFERATHHRPGRRVQRF